MAAANIAEGFKKRGRKDKARFMNIAHGSLEECRYYLILSKDLNYGNTTQLEVALEEVSKMLNSYAQAILSSDRPFFLPKHKSKGNRTPLYLLRGSGW